jgi:hypothetical protein
MNWKADSYDCWTLDVEVKGYVPKFGNGTYQIIIQPRPHYCDRGDWIIFVEGHNNDIDAADGFPRYFFGTIEEAKLQMETWLNRRQKYRLTVCK